MLRTVKNKAVELLEEMTDKCEVLEKSVNDEKEKSEFILERLNRSLSVIDINIGGSFTLEIRQDLLREYGIKL